MTFEEIKVGDRYFYTNKNKNGYSNFLIEVINKFSHIIILKVIDKCPKNLINTTDTIADYSLISGEVILK